MADRDLILALARVMIAAAWADGELHHDEINSLKGMLLSLRRTGFERGVELTGREWARLEMYIESPVEADERARLVVALQNRLRRRSDKEMVLEALQNVMAADGRITDEEQAVLAEMASAIEATEVGLGGLMERLVGSQVRQRQAAVADAPNREAFFSDYLRNKVFYALSRHLPNTDVSLALPEAEQRRLSLAGGLMAKVAHSDGQLTEAEFRAMVSTIRAHWSLSPTEAAFVAEVAIEAVDQAYDATRMMRRLAAATSESERRQFLAALFAVAAADGHVSLAEHEEIRLIARGINLTHQDFIDAKLQVLGRE